MNNNKKVIVTGGLGYIGSHTVIELHNAGYVPIIIDNLSNASISTLDSIEKIINYRPVFYQFDLTDYVACKNFFEEYPDVENLIHFAAHKAVNESVINPLKYYHNNLTSIINILECTKSNKNINIVFSSSCTVYGQPDNLPVTELTVLKTPESPYGNTKKIGEEIFKEAANVYSNLKVISLRYFNPVGAHSSALIGELPNGVPQNLMPFITQSAVGKLPPIKIFGNDYSTEDGTCIRDYIHVVDLAKAHVKSIEYFDSMIDISYDVFNVGTGKGTSVLELITAFEDVNDLILDYKITDRRPGDIEKIYASVDKAKSTLNWESELNLADIVKSAWNWEIRLKQTKI